MPRFASGDLREAAIIKDPYDAAYKAGRIKALSENPRRQTWLQRLGQLGKQLIPALISMACILFAVFIMMHGFPIFVYMMAHPLVELSIPVTLGALAVCFYLFL